MTPEAQRALLKAPHFWVALALAVADALLGSGAVPAGTEAMRLLVAVRGVIGLVVYQLGASWAPPRVPWNGQQRADAGLAPADNQVGKVDGGAGNGQG